VRLSGTPTTIGLADTKVSAEEAERRAVNAALSGKPLVPALPSSSPTLEVFQTVFLEHSDTKNEYSTTKAKRQILRDHLVPAFGPLPLDAITFAKIEDFKHYLVRAETAKPPGKELSHKTANNVLTVLRRLLVLAHRRGELAAVPIFEWLHNEPSDFDFLDFDDSEALISAADLDQWRAMITVAIKCGLRQGELLGLRWSDVDLKNGKLWVRRAIVRGRVKLPKNRKPREIPLGDDVRAALQAHRHLRGELVFCDEEGNRLTNGECKWPLYRACAKAGLRRVGWHVLRHTFGSQLASQGVSMRQIQLLMGHQSIKTTERYAHLSPHVARDAVKRLDRVAHPLASRTRNNGNGQDQTG
jgi:integrase